MVECKDLYRIRGLLYYSGTFQVVLLHYLKVIEELQIRVPQWLMEQLETMCPNLSL